MKEENAGWKPAVRRKGKSGGRQGTGVQFRGCRFRGGVLVADFGEAASGEVEARP